MSETKKMANERPVYAFNRKIFCEGMRDGIPIALGYLAVSFSLGIAARNAGLTAFQGFLASLRRIYADRCKCNLSGSRNYHTDLQCALSADELCAHPAFCTRNTFFSPADHRL
mgnify:CR=1 FL=1